MFMSYNKRKRSKQMKTVTKKELTCERPILDLEDLLRDKTLRVIGIVADKDQGKSMLMYNMVEIIRRNAPETNLVGFRMSVNVPGMLMLNTLTELSKVSNSYIFIDELKTFVDTDNRREMGIFMSLLQTLYHPYRNNTVVICGLAHNFNGKISGELEAIIFKQTTLISVVKRSNLDYILRSLQSEGKASKNEYSLVMPKNTALIYHPNMRKNWHCIDFPYLPQYDVKKDNEPVIKWQNERKD
jgi:hypothetical protein